MFELSDYILLSYPECEKITDSIFRKELKLRGISENKNSKTTVILKFDDSFENKDSYRITIDNNCLEISAKGTRGIIYGIGRFLRKIQLQDGKAKIVEDIDGYYTPYMEIRGHQLGYRVTSNTYEAWTPEQYYDYIKDIMFFGCNTIEHTIFHETDKSHRLMKYSQADLVRLVNEKAKLLDVDISYWTPNDEKDVEESAKERSDFFKNQPYGDIYFPPGSDPGEFNADELIDRVIRIAKEIRKTHPNIQLWPSAQSPDGFGKWGDDFIAKIKSLPNEIDGIITGPNCAMPLHELRKKLPEKYPIRLYPDITHNLRCEYPVHFDRDDWHHSLSSTLSRESINPRPTEYRTIHRMTRQYIKGSVTYSEGLNDDINKFVWSDMDFTPDVSLYDTLSDYARLFFYGANTKKIVDGIFGLELNWVGDPCENPHIENTHRLFSQVANENPELMENVRFLMCLFRAKCDLLIRKRRIFENELVKKAKMYLRKNDIDSAYNTLNTPYDNEYNSLHDEIFKIGNSLFEKAGMQLDTKHYCASGWERGATLDTIDNPISDRMWLINRIDYCKTLQKNEQSRFLTNLINRNKVDKDEFYFSFAENSFTELGINQEPYFYMDFQGDRPEVNNGSIPMSMLKVFDHYSFKLKTGGLTGKNYNLILNIKPRYRDEVDDFTIKINGKILYKGVQYGGQRDKEWEQSLSSPKFETHIYNIPSDFIENGCIELEIREPKVGIMLSEIFIKKA